MMNQTLSLLLDGELDAEEQDAALDEILANPEMQRSWHRLYTLRAAIRDSGVHTSVNLVDKVALALETEPTIIAPDNLAAADKRDANIHAGGHKIIPLNIERKKVVAYAAIAASFAALLMVSYSPDKTATPGIADSTTAIAPGSLAVAQELQSMVVQHGEFSGAAALNGLVAYAKVVNGSTVSGTQ